MRMSVGSTPRPYWSTLPSPFVIASERDRLFDHFVPCPTGPRLAHACFGEQVAVVVDDEARDVLWQADELAVEPEGVERLGVEVVLLERVGAFEARLDRLEHLANGELAEEAVVDQEEVGRLAACERR